MKPTIIISLVVALVFFTLGYVLGASLPSPTGSKTGGSLLSSLNTGANTFQAGWEAAKKRLSDSGFGTPMANLEIKNLTGQVTAVKGNAITLKIRPLEPLADPSLDERTVIVDSNTKIYVLAQKDQAEYQKEMEDFNKKMQEQLKNPPKPGQAPASPAGAIMPPELFVKKSASLSDIKVGATISVVAVDKDIKNVKQFTAAEIIVQPATAIAPTAAAPLSAPTAATPPTGQPTE